MSRHPSATLLATAMLAALPLAPALAQQPPRERGQDEPAARAERATLSDAVRRVERNTRGEVLSAERVQYDGRDMHRVKVVDNQGRVRVFMQDPTRGAGNDGRGRQEQRPPRPTRDDDN